MEALEALEFKLALADNAEKFSNVVNTFLCPLLEKLSSNEEQIRNKVISILTHINKRTSSASEVTLPVLELIHQFNKSNHALVSNFDLVYIEMGFARIKDTQTKRQCLQLIIPDYHKRTLNQQSVLFHLIITNVEHVSVDSIHENLQDSLMILSSMLDVMLYSQTRQGLGPKIISFITNQDKFTGLSSVKLPILKWLMEIETKNHPQLHSAIFLVFLAASADANHEIVSYGDDAIKKRGRPSFEDPWIIARLFTLYLGNTSRSGVGLNLKYKILNLLAKSAVSTNTLPFVVQVVFDSLYGENVNSRVRLAGMGYMQWVIRMANEDTIGSISQLFLSGILKFLAEVNVVDTGVLNAREFAYGALAALLKRQPALLSQQFDIISTLFDAIPSETQSVRPAVQEALSVISDIVNSEKLSNENLASLKQLVLMNIESDLHYSKYSAVKFATNLLPSDRNFFTFALLLASGDSKLEIRELCHSGLEFKMELLVDLNVLLKIFKHYYLQTGSTESLELPKIKISSFGVKVLGNFVRYIRNLLLISCDPIHVTAYGSYNHHTKSIADLSDAFELTSLNLELRSKLQKWFQNNEHGDYVDILKHILNEKSFADTYLQSVTMVSFRDYIIFGPQKDWTLIEWIKTFLHSQKLECRTASAHILGVALSADSKNALNFVNKAIETCDAALENSKQSTKSDVINGQLIAMGFVIGRLLYRQPSAEIPNGILKKLFELIVAHLKSDSSDSITSALTCVSEIFRYYSISKTLNAQQVFDSIMEVINNNKENRVVEQAIMTLSYLNIPSDQFCQKSIDFMFELANSKSKLVDLQLTIGEGLSCILSGWESSSAQLLFDLYDNNGNLMKLVTKQRKVFSSVLDTILGPYLIENQKSPAARRSVCIWLLSIVKFCGTSNEIVQRLGQIQKGFSVMLGDKDDFVQEIAAKGLSIVYSLGNDSIKEDLVKGLMGSFSDDTSTKLHNVTGETELFEPGVIDKDGSSVTTYKELCALASDMNKPDLVYKFMSLASHNHLWNTKRGAAFGFSEILSQANEELKPHLPKLIPKLYRYSFDPQTKVAASMKNIWDTLVPDNRKTLDEYFDIIMADLLQSIVHRQWRTRESACNALNDLLSGREMDQLVPYLEKLWQMTFRALDDIKESVRKSGFNLCRSLTNMTIRYCEPSSASKSQAAKILGIVVPYMLKHGLMSASEDVQKFALSTVLSICKKTGSLVAPFAADIVEVLLEKMSSLEPQVMNYLSFHVDKYDISQEQLDNARMSAAKMSPVMEAVEICSEHINEDSFTKLLPSILNLIRKGVGLPTKGGAARFVVIACIKIPGILSNNQEKCDSILKALSGAILDRSAALRLAFASASGYIIKYCSPDTSKKFFSHLRNIYSEHEETEHHEAVALTLGDISKHSSDLMKNFASDILPIVYFGTFDGNETISNLFKDVWEKNTGSLQMALKLYEQELSDLIKQNLKSASWPSKIQASNVLISMKDGFSNEDRIKSIVDAFIDALTGRIWTGKESLLAGIVSCSKKLKEFGNQEYLEKIKTIIIKESKKNNKIYKRYAIDTLAEFLDVADSFDCFNECAVIVEKYTGAILPTDKTDSMNVDEEDEDEDDVLGKPIYYLLQASCMKAIGASWRVSKMDYLSPLLNNCLIKVANDAATPWNVKTGIINGLKSIGNNLKQSLKNAKDQDFKLVVECLLKIIADGKYGSLREDAVDVLKIWTTLPLTNEVSAWTRQQISTAKQQETTPNIQLLLEQLLQ